MPKQNIILLITHGFRVRNILYTSLWHELLLLGNVSLLCAESEVAGLRKEFGGVATIVGYPNAPHSRWEEKSGFVRRFILSNPARNRTINVFSLSRKHKKPIQYRLESLLNACLGPWRISRRAWRWLERQLFSGTEFDALIEALAPAIILTTDYGTNPVEIRLLRSARRKKCRSISIVNSWDNLSSKGVMGESPDYLVVWNEIMVQEAAELHDFDPQKVLIGGAAQFDAFFAKNDVRTRELCCREWGLNPAKPILTIGTMTTIYFPHQLELIRLVLEARRSGELLPELQIIIRVHPQNVDGGDRDPVVEQIKQLKNTEGDLMIDIPPLIVWGNLMAPDPKGYRDLREILSHSIGILHPGSTLSVDAAIMDCPIIGIAFDGRIEEPYERSIRRWWDFTYQKPILESGAVTIVRNKKEMLDTINAYIADRTWNQVARRQLAHRLCHYTDGRSGERVGKIVAGILNQK